MEGNMDNFKNALREVMDTEYDKSVSKMARAMGINRGSLHRFMNEDESGLSTEYMQKVYEFLKMKHLLPTQQFQKIPVLESVLIQNRLQPSNNITYFAFRREWLSQFESKKLGIVYSESDELTPVINKGDVILINQDEAALSLIENKIYLVKKGADLFIRRYSKGENILFFSADDGSEDIRVDEKIWEDFDVLAKVEWVGKKL